MNGWNSKGCDSCVCPPRSTYIYGPMGLAGQPGLRGVQGPPGVPGTGVPTEIQTLEGEWGPLPTPIPSTLSFFIVNETTCILTFPSVIDDAGGGVVSTMSFSAPLPLGFLPDEYSHFVVSGINNGVLVNLDLLIDTSGNITFSSALPTPVVFSGVSGMYRITVWYKIVTPIPS